MKTLILGLGNPILGDDSIGWKVVEQVKDLWINNDQFRNNAHENQGKSLEFECYSLGGISLMENLIGFDRVWIVDAIHTGKYPVGTIVCERLENFQEIPSGHLTSTHDMTLQTALELGRFIGAQLPTDITVIGVEANIDMEFSEQLSAPLRNAFPEVVTKVFALLQQEATYDLS